MKPVYMVAGLLAMALVSTACSSPASIAGSPAPVPGSPAATASAEPTSAAVDVGSGAAPATGTQLLAALPTDGRVSVISSGSGFTVVQSVVDLSDGDDRSTATTYDAAGDALATIPVGSFTGECGAADVTVDGKRLIITALSTTKPAEGVDPALHSESMTAWDARAGSKVWNTEVVAPQRGTVSCSASDARRNGQNSGSSVFTVTSDGRWGVLHVYAGQTAVDAAMDLATGRLYPRSDILAVLGDYLVSAQDPRYLAKQTAAVSLPPNWSPLGTFTLVNGDQDPGVLAEFPSEMSSGVFNVISAGSSPPTGMADDGMELFTYEARPTEIGYGHGLVKAYRLPTMTPLWSHTPPAGVDVQLVAEGGGVLIVESVNDDGTATTVQGLDADTGKPKWSLPAFDVCGITHSQLLASANGQLAIIDLAGGKQLSYGTTGGNSCPTVLPGGVAMDDHGGITQVLAP